MISLLILLSLATFIISPLVAATRHYNIVNNCPLPITLFINGESQGTLSSSGGSTTREYPDGWSGFIYTDFNRGNQDGAGTVRAGFYGTGNYYYVVKDTNWLNVGVGISPIERAPKGGFCFQAVCEVNNCPDAFTQPPTAFPPNQGGVPPSVPLYECPVANTGYTVTFCPSGTIPNYQTGPNAIQPTASNTKCLEVRGGLTNGAAVQINDCSSPNGGANKWVIKRGNQQIKVSGTSYCLDAGSSPANGIGAKIWQCFDNLAAQQWTYTPDNFIRLTNTSLFITS
ncbi:ricin B lectin domain-containing protein [Crepidotus variabilis]|uniref:Ricin B lectin domain-containing protein n=1 Tax=Crepidotus variabilis TaxID=179855 RepID=A0A9P6E452_9AGAR|nr:ricin B lectin domain-containing protein [Crepidotus variabilis]